MIPGRGRRRTGVFEVVGGGVSVERRVPIAHADCFAVRCGVDGDVLVGRSFFRSDHRPDVETIELVEVGRPDFTAVPADISPAQIIGEDADEVRLVRSGCG
jgi:hypothetical protein